jgi:hypothetical protein
MFARGIRNSFALLCLFFLAACGGGSSGSGQPSGSNPPPPPPPPATSIDLSSDAGDYIGQGRSYSYTQADSEINVAANGALLTISINGDEGWGGEFELPNTFTQLEVGVYSNLTRYPFHDPAVGGLSWSGEGRGCNTLTGSITINEVVYDGASLTLIDLSFEQYCEGGAAALRGDIIWNANDATSPPGPTAPPAGLWEPAAGTTPGTGNYIYLESQAGDYIGQGQNHLYSQADSLITVSDAGGRLAVSINGNENWFGDFQVMSSINFLEVGYYGDLGRYPFQNPAKGGLSWSGEGRGCNTLTGWFVVDSVTYDGNTLTAIDLRFEQHCEGGGPALNGEIHWDINDSTSPPGPVLPPPAGLWEPAAGVTPDTGNYVYLESEIGDYIGQGGNYLYTPADSVITINESGSYLGVWVDGDDSWSGDFKAMDSLMRLEVGYYGDLQRYPFQNPVKGGLSWSGEGRGCNTLTGWFVVDSVTYDGNTLAAIDLRFEQHCEGGGPALNGEIHWDANDTTSAPGPDVPPPGLWDAAPGTTPASGNYVYLESTPGDWVGQGGTYSYTPADAVINVGTTAALLDVNITGDENWSGNFQGMNSISRLEAGYYGDLQRYPFHNPVKGGLSWSGEGRGCNTLTGWFAIDSVTYNGNALEAIELRFEQRCDGGPPLFGKIRWDVNEATMAPGPVVPPPAGLWEPTPGVVPTTGNYVYLESDIGDYIGGGQNYLYTPADATIGVVATGARVDVSVRGDEDWGATFQGMNSISRLEVGYYGDLQRYPFHNPVKGGLSWSGEGRGCNTLTGWFVIDNLTYDGSTLTAIDLRFEQRCDGGPPLHGEIHWDANDATEAPGPVVPPPAGLWAPAGGITPATGNYVYLESDIGDYIGGGQNYLYTDADNITIDAPGAALTVGVDGWSGRFQGMNSLNFLEVGYYGDLQRYPFHNPVKGGLSWSGQGRGCNTLSGWFVVDNVTYDGVTLTSVDLRFEQRCDGGPPLHGEIHWSQ